MGCKSCKPLNPTEIPDNLPLLESLVSDYLNRKFEWPEYPDKGAVTAQEWHDIYLSSLEDVTDFICGKINPTKAPGGMPYVFNIHQWNLRFPSRQNVVDKMAEKLGNIDDNDFGDFEELIDYVEKRKVPYFGETAVYDFALRYGWNHRPAIKPSKYVYIHSKPRKAAQHLADHGYLKNITKLERKMELEKYQELLLPGMEASDVEHFLCCYHDEILKLK